MYLPFLLTYLVRYSWRKLRKRKITIWIFKEGSMYFLTGYYFESMHVEWQNLAQFTK